ncbi:MAG: glutamine--fructose-6-phosphate transaminase (isomerizing) [Gemmataceae bacterium]|nr:glutamine--fructose-6-phosphate transaminase (isomerizing) [Gemmataceae bacterium]MCS7269527.1 glutamine--fructose-6-phosphate transaminase (isomerizing) [Gemmataceae bacterium]MDW8243939.1 glutamine--fructose-6-phosphate transaminase (isomerizing) [Thermogemmata sp.]
MCGIIGFTGRCEAAPILLEGLRRLEYRGYDSAGLVTGTGRQLHVRKKAGRLCELLRLLAAQPAAGCYGIGHTRWATHGPANDRNAHPHTDSRGWIAVVHNGVIDNYAVLREQLQRQGVVFRSDTDTEVLAHLIARCYQGDLVGAVQQALQLVRGTYGLAVVCQQEPGIIVAARLGSPLVIGSGRAGRYLASDAHALAGWVDKLHYLEDGQICQLSGEDCELFDQRLAPLTITLQDAPGELTDGLLDKGDYPHFMLKEIYEQPEALTNAMRGRLHEADATAHFGGLNLTAAQLRQVERIIITGCGTSYYAGLVGEYLIEELARLPVEVEYASELRYRHPPLDRHTILLAITQSGETADTLAAVREAKRRGQITLAICNVVGSSIAREADGGVYLHAGPEIGVASTKAFTAQCLVLTLLALYLGRLRHLSAAQGQRILQELRALPEAVRAAFACHTQVKSIAEKYAHVHNALYLGRQYLYPVALEGALKLKEISYIHAEGYPAAEMKHGPIALVDEHTPSVFLVPRGQVFDKVLANMQEIKARGGPIIAVVSGHDPEVAALADDVISIPHVPEYLQPIVAVVPLQLLAYEMALLRGCDVDRPRHLAKSVTVE